MAQYTSVLWYVTSISSILLFQTYCIEVPNSPDMGNSEQRDESKV